jgi:hypothetical protein
MDAAAAKGKSLDEVISAVGAASAGGRAMALKEYGLGFLDLEKDMSHAGAEARNFDKITKALSTNFKGGMEDIVNNTDWGKVKNFELAFGNFKEELGRDVMMAFKAVLPYLKEFVAWMKEALHWVEKHKDALMFWGKIALEVFVAAKIYSFINTFVGGFKQMITLTKALTLETKAFAAAEAMAGAAGTFDNAAKGIGDIAVGGKSIWEDAGHTIGKGLMTFLAGGAGLATLFVGLFAANLWINERAKFFDAKDPKQLNDFLSEKNRSDYEKGLLKKDERENFLRGQYQWSPASAKGTPNAASGKKMTGGDLGSGISEPKESKIKQITINVNNPFNNMKITPKDLNMAMDEIAPKFTEFLVSLVTDAAIVSTE